LRFASSRVVAQVEHQALQRPLLEEPVDVLHQVLRRGFLELRYAHPAVARLDDLGLDALHADDGARQRDDQRRGLALARDGERDVRVRLAAHPLHGIVERHALHRRVVELDDEIARLDAGAKRGGVLDGGDDLDEAVFHSDLDAEPSELALGADLQLLERLGVEVGRVRIEARQHAVDRLGDEPLVLHGLDVVGLHRAEDVGEGAQLLDRQGRARGAIGDRLEIQADQNTGHDAHGNETGVFQLALHVFDSCLVS
jgi:hypothetical protein